MVETQTRFNKALTKAVHAYFKQHKNGRYATPFAWIKAVVLLVSFFLLYYFIVFGSIEYSLRLMLVVLWGIVSLLIVFNIGHDAVHGAFSRYQRFNKLLGYSFNLVGANAYSWKLKHNEAHHLFTNIDGKDHDVEMDPFLRVSPHMPYRWYFRWQHLYWPFIYTLLSLLIIFVVDFLIFFQERKPGQRLAQPLREWSILIFTKLFYLFYIFVVPVYFAGFTWSEVLVAFLALHVVNGLLIGLVFQPSHYFLESRFHKENEKGSPYFWHRHQLESTVDMSPGNRLLSHVLGSLNNNVAHHLYPNICHVHYPHLSGIIKELTEQYHVPYNHKSYTKAVLSHVALLKQLSRPN